MKKIISILGIIACVTACFSMTASVDAKTDYSYVGIQDVLNLYQNDNNVNQVLYVAPDDDTVTTAQYYVKKTNSVGYSSWVLDRECVCYTGKGGVDKVKEGDCKTPIGVFSVITAFGIKDDPGTSITYVKATDDIYCCGCSKYYNQIISSKTTGHKCKKGEHLIDYNPDYDYGIFFNYNEDGVVGKGSSLFIHCMGNKNWTHGCVALPEEDMKYILQNADQNMKICIWPAS